MCEMRLPIGSSDFGKIIQSGYDYVDKTLLIRDFLNEVIDVILITRPRRWGKTMVMSMLEHFFAKAVIGESTEGLFDQLAISRVENGRYIRDYQGQYPVISLTLKDVIRFDTLEEVIDKIAQEVGQCCERLNELPEVAAYLEVHGEQALCLHFQRLMRLSGSQHDVMGALYTLSHLLNRVYGKRVYILLDEYDMPLNRTFGSPYFDQLSEFMRVFLGAGFKDNPYLAKGLMTGILQVSKSSMLSGLNNLDVYTVLDDKYSPYFGFTESEVKVLLEKAQLPHPSEVKDWYNGYTIGGLTLYNPWSIANYMDKRMLRPYWINTGNNDLIKKVLVGADKEIKTDLESMLKTREDGSFEKVSVALNAKIRFDFLEDDASAFWSLLLSAGYVTASDVFVDETNLYHCQLRLPNREVKGLYQAYIEEWFQSNKVTSEQFVKDLIAGDVVGFQEKLEYFLEHAISYHDVSRYEPEKFYHGFVLGLVIGVKDYMVESNRESGLGRYDVMLLPKDPKKYTRGIIFEFKTARLKESLDEAADAALAQIISKNYVSRCKALGLKDVLLIGLGFKHKEMAMRFKQGRVEEF